MVAGVAWAQHRGIRRSRCSRRWPVGAGRLAADPTIDSWRQWVYEWQATPGNHTIAVRATDDTGETQTSQAAGVVPNGATGYHSIGVSVG